MAFLALYAGVSVALHRWMKHPYGGPRAFWSQTNPVGCAIDIVSCVVALVVLMIGTTVLGNR